MTAKIFRDPLYNYISIDTKTDGWLLELLDTPEVQRLRRIHQLGVSHFTYPGAEHSRLSHSLGVLHLMQEALEQISKIDDAQTRRSREPLLAAALLHDVGHAPFSHLFEPCLEIDHEEWTKRIILAADSSVNRVLVKHDISPTDVAKVIEEDIDPRSAWKKSLLSSQLDVDRLDYLRRDSLFTGAGYGHYDFFRLLHSFELHEENNGGYRDLVWSKKAAYAIEEYIFSRFYMYENVYMHKTTRGYEKLLHKMWELGKQLRKEGANVPIVKPIEEFWDVAENGSQPSINQFLALEEHVVLSQIQLWCDCNHDVLSDLARRFMHRQGFVAIDAPEFDDPFDEEQCFHWENRLKSLVSKEKKFQPAEAYVLRDDFKTKIYSAYEPERDQADASPINTIRILHDEESPVEISELLPRLKAVTNKPKRNVRYYIPREIRDDALNLRKKIKG